jgi:hypothetical protein
VLRVLNRLNMMKKMREAEEITQRQKAERAKAEEIILKARVVEAEAHEKLLVAYAKGIRVVRCRAAVECYQKMVVEATSRLAELNNKIEDSKKVLVECDKEVRSRKQLNRYCDKVPVITSGDEVTKLAAVIEGA